MKMRVEFTCLRYFTLMVEVSMGGSVIGLKRLATVDGVSSNPIIGSC